MRFLLSLLLITTTVALQAQVLDGKTKVLNEPQGDPLFELNAGEKLYSYTDDEGWYKVRKEVWLEPNDLIEEEYVSEGTELKTKEGEKIGICLKELKVAEKRLIKGFRGKDRYVVILEGHVFRTKIAEGSIPELKISALLQEKNRSKQKAGFEALYEQYDFEKKEYGQFNVAVMREENKTAKEEKDFRVIIIFRGSTVLGVICNDHEVTARKVKSIYEDGSFKGIYLTKPTDKQRALIEDEILYDFLAL
jgi:hypothetical protein